MGKLITEKGDTRRVSVTSEIIVCYLLVVNQQLALANQRLLG